MTDRHRKKILVFVSSASCDMFDHIESIGKILAESFGGVSISESIGFWSDQGDEDSAHYPAQSISKERAVRIELLVMPNQLPDAISKLQSMFAALNRSHKLSLKHVHVEVSDALAHHFIVD